MGDFFFFLAISTHGLHRGALPSLCALSNNESIPGPAGMCAMESFAKVRAAGKLQHLNGTSCHTVSARETLDSLMEAGNKLFLCYVGCFLFAT